MWVEQNNTPETGPDILSNKLADLWKRIDTNLLAEAESQHLCNYIFSELNQDQLSSCNTILNRYLIYTGIVNSKT